MKRKILNTSDFIQELVFVSKKIPQLLVSPSSVELNEIERVLAQIKIFIDQTVSFDELQNFLENLRMLQEVNAIFLQQKAEYFRFFFDSLKKNERSTYYTKIGGKVISSNSLKSAAIRAFA